LESCTKRENRSNEVDDPLVISEELRDVAAKGGEKNDVENADNGCCDNCLAILAI
jgi:hypothetical protein